MACGPLYFLLRELNYSHQCSNLSSVRCCSSVWYSVCTYVRSVRSTYTLYAWTKRKSNEIYFSFNRGETPGPVEYIFARVTARNGTNLPCQRSTIKDDVTTAHIVSARVNSVQPSKRRFRLTGKASGCAQSGRAGTLRLLFSPAGSL